jgi:hypothetical protein
VLQAFAQSVLPLWRKVAELGIVVERFLLLRRREILVASQPLSGMLAGLLLLGWFGSGSLLLGFPAGLTAFLAALLGSPRAPSLTLRRISGNQQKTGQGCRNRTGFQA